jgi:hypothetical protein
MDRCGRLFWRAVDPLDYLLTLARLRILAALAERKFRPQALRRR